MTYCRRCGAPLTTELTCGRCGSPVPPSSPGTSPAGVTARDDFYSSTHVGHASTDVGGKKVAAGVCGILLGALGIHKFVLGYTTEGLIMLLVTIFTCGLGGVVFAVIGLVEGIIYLTKSDVDFQNTYISNKRGWF